MSKSVQVGPNARFFSGAVSLRGKYVQSFSSVTSVTVNHGLGTQDVHLQIFDGAGLLVDAETVTITGINTVVVTFGAAFSGKAVVIG